MPNLLPARSGLKGFDCNTRLTPTTAKALREAGMRFAVRYVGRLQPQAAHDLTSEERDIIHGAGLALMVVQHVERDQAPGWEPTIDKGAVYGHNAAELARMAGVLPGTTLWLDLEGVSREVDPQIVIGYCNNWHRAVQAMGYHPGIYVGWSSRLTARQLYQLRFDRYWAAYNLNSDEHPATRDVCMKQGIQVTIAGVELDPNQIITDQLGGVPYMDTPDEYQAD